MNKPGTKRTPVQKKMIVKKSGSLGDDSDRSLSPTDIIHVKENKPGQRLANTNSLVSLLTSFCFQVQQSLLYNINHSPIQSSPSVVVYHNS